MRIFILILALAAIVSASRGRGRGGGIFGERGERGGSNERGGFSNSFEVDPINPVNPCVNTTCVAPKTLYYDRNIGCQCFCPPPNRYQSVDAETCAFTCLYPSGPPSRFPWLPISPCYPLVWNATVCNCAAS